MTLVELRATENYGYQAFRMNGFHRHQDCFRSKPADQANAPFPTMGTPDNFTLGFLTATNELAGVVSFEREGQTRQKLRHKGLVFGMYVAEEYSGHRLGRFLLEETIRRVRLLSDIEQINLTVFATNLRARGLYEKLGFCSFAYEKNAIKDGDAYYDEEQMVLFL